MPSLNRKVLARRLLEADLEEAGHAVGSIAPHDMTADERGGVWLTARVYVRRERIDEQERSEREAASVTGDTITDEQLIWLAEHGDSRVATDAIGAMGNKRRPSVRLLMRERSAAAWNRRCNAGGTP